MKLWKFSLVVSAFYTLILLVLIFFFYSSLNPDRESNIDLLIARLILFLFNWGFIRAVTKVWQEQNKWLIKEEQNKWD
jgi:hypothetical protein